MSPEYVLFLSKSRHKMYVRQGVEPGKLFSKVLYVAYVKHFKTIQMNFIEDE